MTEEDLFHIDTRGKLFDEVCGELTKRGLAEPSPTAWQQIDGGGIFPFLYVTKPFVATLYHGKEVPLTASKDLVLFPEGWGAWTGHHVFEFGDMSGYRQVPRT